MTQDELDKAVLWILNQHAGRRNAISRWQMVEKVFGFPVPTHLQNDDHPQDREIRYAVARLRAKGHLICDLGDGAGRYLAQTADEFWEMYSAYVKPIRARAEVARAMKRAAEQRFPNLLQPSLFGAAKVEV